MPSTLYRTRRFIEYAGWLADAKEAAMSKAAEAESPDNDKSEVSLSLKWIYGINMTANPPIQFFPYSSIEGKPNLTEAQLIYTCGPSIIIYNPNTHKQQYYMEHRVFF